MDEKSSNRIYCFPPLIYPDSQILFLGSAPSVLSRRNNFFYGNPTNRFWKILSTLLNEDFVHADNATKTALLRRHRIALSDVYASCGMRKASSSMDSDIIDPAFNPIPDLIQGTTINHIYITSKKAYTDFMQHWAGQIPAAVTVTNLPSPSSANRSVYRTDDALITAWRTLIKQLP